MLGLGEYCVTVRDLTAETVQAKVLKALEKKDEIRAHLQTRIPEIQQMAFRCAEATAEVVAGKHAPLL